MLLAFHSFITTQQNKALIYTHLSSIYTFKDILKTISIILNGLKHVAR